MGKPAEVELWSLLPTARIGDGAVMRDVAFQPFVRQTIALTHPVATIRDEYEGFAESAVYLLTVETGSGVRPLDVGASKDRRWLGVSVKALP